MTATAVIMIIVWIFVIIVVITGWGKPPKDEFVKPDEPPRSYKNTPSPQKMPSKRKYYEVLDIDSNATEGEIKRAFRKLAFKYHPDHNPKPGAEQKFKEIYKAYQVLSDQEKRAAYDRSSDDNGAL